MGTGGGNEWRVVITSTASHVRLSSNRW
jgi:hypothetical protein